MAGLPISQGGVVWVGLGLGERQASALQCREKGLWLRNRSQCIHCLACPIIQITFFTFSIHSETSQLSVCSEAVFKCDPACMDLDLRHPHASLTRPCFTQRTSRQ